MNCRLVAQPPRRITQSFFSLPEAFFQNRRFTLEDLKIIEANLKSDISPTKTLARIHVLDPDVEHSMKDLHNQRAKFRKAKLGFLTSLQNLLKDLESS